MPLLRYSLKASQEFLDPPPLRIETLVWTVAVRAGQQRIGVITYGSEGWASSIRLHDLTLLAFVIVPPYFRKKVNQGGQVLAQTEYALAQHKTELSPALS